MTRQDHFLLSLLVFDLLFCPCYVGAESNTDFGVSLGVGLAGAVLGPFTMSYQMMAVQRANKLKQNAENGIDDGPRPPEASGKGQPGSRDYGSDPDVPSAEVKSAVPSNVDTNPLNQNQLSKSLQEVEESQLLDSETTVGSTDGQAAGLAQDATLPEKGAGGAGDAGGTAQHLARAVEQTAEQAEGEAGKVVGDDVGIARAVKQEAAAVSELSEEEEGNEVGTAVREARMAEEETQSVTEVFNDATDTANALSTVSDAADVI